MRRLMPIVVSAVLALAPAARAQGPTATTGVPPAAGDQATGPTATTGVPPATTTAPAAGAAPAPTATTPATDAPTTTTGAAAAPPASTGGDDDGPAALLIGLAVLLGLGALAVALWGVSRLTAWEPGWLAPVRHSLGEAGYRAGATWAEFRDWARPPPRR